MEFNTCEGGLMPSGLNSPNEVYFFTKKPDQYTLSSGYFYEISQASENTLEKAKANVRNRARFEVVQFSEPTVDVQGKKYSYIVRSSASRDDFEKSMSAEHVYKAEVGGILGLHYSAAERYGDAVGFTIEAETPEVAKEQFQAWYAQIKDALRVLADRFAILNNELDQKIEEAAVQRIDELNRAKKAL
jgi:hypothetical protein